MTLYFEYIFIQINVISKHKFRKEFNFIVRVILGIFEEDTLIEQVRLNEEHTFGIPFQKLNLNLISPTPTPFIKQYISCFKLYYVQKIFYLFSSTNFWYQTLKKFKRTYKTIYTFVLVHIFFLIPRLQNSFTVYLNIKYPHKDVKYVKDLKVNHKYAQTTLNVYKL